MPPFPTFVNDGVFVSGSAAITVQSPGSTEADDLQILCVESANEAITLGTGSANWTQFPGSPVFFGTAAAAGGVRLAAYYRWAANSTPGSQQVLDTGNHTTGIMISIRGVANNASFLNAYATASRSASTNVDCPGVITTKPYTYILNLIGTDKDLADSDTVTAWFPPASAINAEEMHDQSIATAQGGGLVTYGFAHYEKGNSGNTFGTGDSSDERVYLTLAFNTAYKRRITILR